MPEKPQVLASATHFLTVASSLSAVAVDGFKPTNRQMASSPHCRCSRYRYRLHSENSAWECVLAMWEGGDFSIIRGKVSDLGLSYVQMLSQPGNRPKRNTSSESVFSSGCSVARPPFLQVAELTRSPHQIMPKVTLHCSPPPAVVWLDFYAVLLWLFARFNAPFRMRFRSG